MAQKHQNFLLHRSSNFKMFEKYSDSVEVGFTCELFVTRTRLKNKVGQEAGNKSIERIANRKVLFYRGFTPLCVTVNSSFSLLWQLKSKLVLIGYTLWTEKQATRVLSVTSPNANQFSKNFWTGRFSSKFAIKLVLNMLPHFKGVAILSYCEILRSEIAKIV